MELHERAKKRRLELRLSQEEVAKRMGLSHRVSIYNIERGRPITQKTIVKLAKALDTTPAYLMGWDNNDNDQNFIIPKRYKDHFQQWNEEFACEMFSEEEMKDLINYAKFLISKRKDK